MSVRDGNITTLCGLLQWAQVIASSEEREAVWSTWQVEPYAELCAALYDDSRIEEFVSGDAAGLGFSGRQVDSLTYFLRALDTVVGIYPPGGSDVEKVLQSEQWSALAASARQLLIAAKPWSDQYCVDDYNKLKDGSLDR